MVICTNQCKRWTAFESSCRNDWRHKDVLRINARPSLLNAYSEGIIAGVPFKGIGSCQTQADFPEKGISPARCFQALSGLPNNYVGGVILNNGIASQNNIGSTSSPPGYLQSGLATFRLWKKRTSDQ